MYARGSGVGCLARLSCGCGLRRGSGPGQWRGHGVRLQPQAVSSNGFEHRKSMAHQTSASFRIFIADKVLVERESSYVGTPAELSSQIAHWKCMIDIVFAPTHKQQLVVSDVYRTVS